MESHGTIKQGKFLLPAVQRRLREQFLAGMKDGQRIKETLTRDGRAGSIQQARAHFGLIVETIRWRFEEMGVDVCGICPNKEMIHEILIKACGGVGDIGETLRFSEMTTTQRSVFFENCRTWAATQLQLDIPDPQKDWKERQTEIKE